MASAWYQLVDGTKKQRLGARKKDSAGNEYVYLKGCTSNTVSSAISYNSTAYTQVLLAPDAVGAVGVSMSTATGVQYGWAMIYGFTSVKSDTVAAAGGLFIDGTSGRVDDASVAGDYISGMVSTGADVTNVLPVQLNYPMVGNTVPA